MTATPLAFPGISPFDEMQKAVDIVGTSPHPDNKIAATVFGCGTEEGTAFSLSRTNYWPEAIARHIGTGQRIGGSSGTVHAETACLLAAPRTAGAGLCVTDPFCPNCAKNMAEAGIRTVYIDHKGFGKDFAQRRGGAFESLSMQICERAGIGVYRIYRKDRRLETIFEPPPGYAAAEAAPAEYTPFASAPCADAFMDAAEKSGTRRQEKNWACALARDGEGRLFFLACGASPPPGFPAESSLEKTSDGKYSLTLEPVARLLMNAARRGLKIADGLLLSSQVPTSREQINMAGAGLGRFFVSDPDAARDRDALDALQTLSAAGVLSATAVTL